MLTGCPIVDIWLDLYAYVTFLRAHPFETHEVFKQAFSVADQRNPGKRLTPRGKYLDRLHVYLSATTVAVPSERVERPGIVRELIRFQLGQKEKETTDAAFDKYRDPPKETHGVEESEEALIKAIYSASHPRLPELIQSIRVDAVLSGDEGNEIIEGRFTPEEQEIYSKWSQELGKDSDWKSSRILALVSIIERCTTRDRKCKIVIIDESIYFLDIVQIALQNMKEPIEAVRLDGRVPPEQRFMHLDQFSQATVPAVLSASRATAGSGLNLQAASVAILCTPFWNASQERQAVGQVWRHSQTKIVYACTLQAENCKVEEYRVTERDREDAENQAIMDRIYNPLETVPPGYIR